MRHLLSIRSLPSAGLLRRNGRNDAYRPTRAEFATRPARRKMLMTRFAQLAYDRLKADREASGPGRKYRFAGLPTRL